MKRIDGIAAIGRLLGRREWRFRLELTTLIALKITLLLIIKSLWFSDPIAPHMRVPETQVERHFFGAAPAIDWQSSGDPHVQPR